MPASQGSSHQCRIGFEPSFGTDATSTFQVPFIPTFELKQEQPINQSAVIRDSRDPSKPFKGFKEAMSNIVVPLDDEALGYWLKAGLGTVSAPLDNLDGTYTHTFKKTDGTLPSLTIEKAMTDIARYHKGNGFKIGTMSFDFGNDTEPQMSIGMMGKTVSIGGAELVAPTTTNGMPFEPFDVAITGLGAIKVKTGSLSFSNNNDGGQYVMPTTSGTSTGGERGDIPSGKIAIDLSLKILYEDDSLTTDALNETIKNITIPYAVGNSVLTFELEEVMLQPVVGTETTGGGVVEQTFNAIAFLDTGSNASALTVTLRNTKSTSY